jgi:hypothetical protein
LLGRASDMPANISLHYDNCRRSRIHWVDFQHLYHYTTTQLTCYEYTNALAPVKRVGNYHPKAALCRNQRRLRSVVLPKGIHQGGRPRETQTRTLVYHALKRGRAENVIHKTVICFNERSNPHIFRELLRPWRCPILV